MNNLFAALADVTQTKVAKSAVNKAATPILKKAKELVPVATGRLKKSLGKRFRKPASKFGKTIYKVGAMISKKHPAYHAHLVEYGTSKMPAQPFMRPAFDMMKETALSTMIEALAQGIARESGKLASKFGTKKKRR